MKRAQKTRRDRLFKLSRPKIRPVVYDDMRWLWAAARRIGYDGAPTDFTSEVEPTLAQSDRIFMLEDHAAEFRPEQGPVGMVMANHDDWSLVPHVIWFPWASRRNKLRCTVGFLQAMRYTRGVGSIKLFVTEENAEFFKRLRRYIQIILVGKIPGGRQEGTEWIFYLRGRRHDGRHQKGTVRGVQERIPAAPVNNSAHAPSNP